MRFLLPLIAACSWTFQERRTEPPCNSGWATVDYVEAAGHGAGLITAFYLADTADNLHQSVLPYYGLIAGEAVLGLVHLMSASDGRKWERQCRNHEAFFSGGTRP